MTRLSPSISFSSLLPVGPQMHADSLCRNLSWMLCSLFLERDELMEEAHEGNKEGWDKCPSCKPSTAATATLRPPLPAEQKPLQGMASDLHPQSWRITGPRSPDQGSPGWWEWRPSGGRPFEGRWPAPPSQCRSSFGTSPVASEKTRSRPQRPRPKWWGLAGPSSGS